MPLMPQNAARLLSVLVMTLGTLVLTGCSGVYYNTTFNAEKAHKKALALRAERLRLNPDDTVHVTTPEREQLQRAVRKSSKVLELWPDHPKYAPLAVYRIAESQYLMEDYGSAAVKYDEFLRYFPTHEKVPMARVRLAQTYFFDGKSLAAREALDAVMATQPTGVVRREALLLSARMLIAERTAGLADSADGAAGLALYEQLLNEGAFVTPEARNEVRWQAAQLAWDLKQWEKARAYALAANEDIPPMRIQFRNRRLGVLALYRLGRPAEALAEVREMQDARPYRPFRPELKLLEARGVDQQGDWETARRLYRESVRLGPRLSSAAESWFRIGDRFLNVENREDSARAFFDSAAAAGRGHEYGARGAEFAAALKRLAELRLMDSAAIAARREALVAAWFAADSTPALRGAADSVAPSAAGDSTDGARLAAADDSTARAARADSLAQARAAWRAERARQAPPHIREAMAVMDSLEGLKAARPADSVRKVVAPKAPSVQYAPFMIAELFHFRLPKPDSARKFLNRIVADTTRGGEDSVYTPRAFYALAWLEAEGLTGPDGEVSERDPARAAELYRTILARYPATEWAKAAERNLGLPATVVTRNDSARALFVEAERRRFAGEDLATRVKPAYREVVTRFPQSPLAAKAQFAIAFLVDEAAERGALGPPGQATVDSVKAEYLVVRDRFMGTPQAERAGRRIDLLNAASTDAPPPPSEGRGSGQGDGRDGEDAESMEGEGTPRPESLDDGSEQDLY